MKFFVVDQHVCLYLVHEISIHEGYFVAEEIAVSQSPCVCGRSSVCIHVSKSVLFVVVYLRHGSFLLKKLF